MSDVHEEPEGTEEPGARDPHEAAPAEDPEQHIGDPVPDPWGED